MNIEQLTYRYQQETFCFDTQIEQGKLVSILGNSGAGKSTFFALLGGFLSPTHGDFTFDGKSLLSLQPHQRPFSILFQEHNLFDHLTVKDNVGLGISPKLKLSSSEWAEVALAAQQVGLGDLMERLPTELSGGQKQRAALARCLVQRKPVWLMDEPFSALDPVLRNEMLSLVAKLAKEHGVTVLMITHFVQDALAITDEFRFIEQGKILASGAIESLTEDHSNPTVAQFVKAGNRRTVEPSNC